MKPTHHLRLAATEEPTRQEVALAAIEQSHREYRSPSGDISNPHGWQTIETETENVLAVDEIHQQQYRVVVSSPVPWWRQLVRKLRGQL